MNGKSIDNRPRCDSMHDEDALLKVGLRPYRRFSLWMDNELAELVARWVHTAAPDASRTVPRLSGQAAESP